MKIIGEKMKENNFKKENDDPFYLFENLLKNVNRSWAKMKKVLNTWEFNNLESTIRDLSLEIKNFNSSWNETEISLKKEYEEKNKFLNSDNYKIELENNFKELQMPFHGNFPEYDIIPLKLIINLDILEAKLFYGRKSDKTNALNPKILSQWVFNKYKALTGKKFDEINFMKELKEAYSIVNQLTFREKNVIWGKAVSLIDIYNKLTLRRSAKQDYPKQLYLYELGRLKENSNMSYENYKFEFGFEKNPSKALLIIDSKGVESRLGSLTIYKNI